MIRLKHKRMVTHFLNKTFNTILNTKPFKFTGNQFIGTHDRFTSFLLFIKSIHLIRKTKTTKQLLTLQSSDNGPRFVFCDLNFLGSSSGL